jgi:hypothetical protein|tara:strand:+ start:632 stop:1189 length:558 start_codon:yes stop_codon:yes gene_type:complete
MSEYYLHESQYIIDNKTQIFDHLDNAHRNFHKLFPSSNDSTWSYNLYNVFALTAPSTIFHGIYKELGTFVKSHLGNERPLWIQAWLNYHKHDECLTRHGHEFDYHGYISIDPKKTNTVFDNWTIENKPGQIYFGPGNAMHEVQVLEPYEGYRTTIGFDVHTIPNSPLYRNYEERPFGNMGLMPLL